MAASSGKVSEIDERARKFLLGKKRTLIQLADHLRCPPKEAARAANRLADAGYNVHLAEASVAIERDVPQSSRLVVNSKDFFDGSWYKFGFATDTHLCSKYARLDVLRCAYKVFQREGISTVFHAGNIVDGEARFNKFDLLVRSGFEAQIEYALNEYPAVKGIATKFITGDDHEGWYSQREGINFGKRLQQDAEKAGRADLQYIGHMETDIRFKNKRGAAWGRVVHPGGGSSYATSYTEQKLVESLQGGEKPHFILLGHYHKFNHGYSREVHTVQGGCTCDQTPFMRKKKLQAHVGFSIVRFHQAETGEINRMNVEWFPFYDRGFYEKGDRYRIW